MRVAGLLLLLACAHVLLSEDRANCKAQCIEKEKQALLTFKQGLVDSNNLLASWISSSRDCCTWKGIRCDNLTHHIIMLDLSMSRPIGGEIGPSLVELQHLGHLDLSYNSFTKIPNFIGSLTTLTYLNIAANPIGGSIPSQLGNLTKLCFLDLSSYHQISAVDLEWLSHLPSLKTFRLTNTDLTKAKYWFQSIKTAPSLSSLQLYDCQFAKVDVQSLSHQNSSNSLRNIGISQSTIHPTTVPWLLNLSSNLLIFNISRNQIKGPIPNSFENMRSLVSIDLWGNQFEGVIPKSLGDLCNLQTLVVGSNSFNGTLQNHLENLSGCAKDSLEKLDLSRNQLGGSFPNPNSIPIFLRKLRIYDNKLEGPLPDGPDLSILSYLKVLDLSKNKLNGTLTEGIGQLHNLEYLDISSNSLTGIVSEVHLQKLSKLKVLSFAFNSLTLNFNFTWIPPFQLVSISLNSYELGPQFPSWLRSQVKINYLDISNSKIQGDIPNWFCNQTSQLDFINLSNNQLQGLIPPSLSIAKELYLYNNKLTSFKSFICDPLHGATEILDLSNNLLFESLPECWWNLKTLIVLNLDNNKLFGVIPSSIGLLYEIQNLRLRCNNFSGNLPSSLKNCTQLQVLDVEQNNLEGKIPTWIGERLTNLIILRLKSNKFHGRIPSNLCHLRSVQILDLSMNNMSEAIPSCMNNLTSMVEKGDQIRESSMIVIPVHSFYSYEVNDLIIWKGKYYEFDNNLGLLRIIDLSNNKLTGAIPEELTDLVELVQLNLSRNNLTGAIPAEIGKLINLESLDLSHNKLISTIPSSLAKISSLSFLDLSNNQLSGRIPMGTQLQTFEASRYTGNPGLCGPPLTSSCPEDKTGLQDSSGHDKSVKDDQESFDMKWFHMGIGVGFVVGFVGVCGNLLLNTYYRLAYFQFLNNLGDWLYVIICVKVAMLKRRFSS